jgi:DHA1 family bicyclomycin/chloramphenicol resistance-like MFS transporter
MKINASAQQRVGSNPGLSRTQLALSSALSPFAMVVVAPLLPMIGRGYEVDPAATQYVVSVFLFGLFAAQLFLGPLSDRIGRRTILLGSLAIYIVMSILCALAPSFQLLVAARFFQACGAAGTSTVVRAMVHDVHRGDTAARYMAFIAVGHSIAHTLSPTIGGLIGDAVGIGGTFIMLAVLGAAMLAWAFFRMPETRAELTGAPPDAGRILRDSLRVLCDPLFFAYSAVYGLTGAGFFAFLAIAPAYFDSEFGVSGAAFGFYWSYMSVAFLIAAMSGGRLVARFGRRAVFNWCLGLCAGLGALLPEIVLFWGASPATIVAPMVLLSGILGVTSPLSLSGAIASQPNLAGTASGLCGSLAMAYSGVFTILAGVIYDGTVTTLVLPMTAAMVLMAACAIAIAKLEPRTGAG